jgi:thymidine phosphorylase
VTARDSVAELIRKKRDGGLLSEAAISHLVAGIADGSVSDAQIAAFAMAVFFRGMTRAECAALTRAMTRSGSVLAWPNAGGPILDKHSTGGVGDKVSLILAPVIAACGGIVPMISGRGLGHTGGTLDKLGSIPGYDTTPDLARLRVAVNDAGCAIVGQTADLAPADRRLYAIRDVTGTVESIPLITASILSKKLAAGLDALVMDVKVGSGAFTASLEAAIELTENLLAVAEGAGLRAAALLTDMGQVLGRHVGNALEIREAIGVLTGGPRDVRLHAVFSALTRELLVLGGLARDDIEAGALVEKALESGAAAERFARMVRALGGPADIVECPASYFPPAPIEMGVTPEAAGVIGRIDARALGLAVVELGGGRRRLDDAIDPAVGLTDVRGVGEVVDRDRPLAIVHARSVGAAEAAAWRVRRAVTVSEEPTAPSASPILRRMASPSAT